MEKELSRADEGSDASQPRMEPTIKDIPELEQMDVAEKQSVEAASEEIKEPEIMGLESQGKMQDSVSKSEKTTDEEKLEGMMAKKNTEMESMLVELESVATMAMHEDEEGSEEGEFVEPGKGQKSSKAKTIQQI